MKWIVYWVIITYGGCPQPGPDEFGREHAAITIQEDCVHSERHHMDFYDSVAAYKFYVRALYANSRSFAFEGELDSIRIEKVNRINP